MEVKPLRVLIMLIFLGILCFLPAPWGVTTQAWHLFATDQSVDLPGHRYALDFADNLKPNFSI
ncbi:MAG: hypothetical protein V3W52_08600 [Syntrophobacteria bacterium]